MWSPICDVVELERPKEEKMIRVPLEDVEEIIAFVKMHEREEISDEMWEVVMKLQNAIEEETE